MAASLFGLPVAHASAWIFNCYIIHDDAGLVVFDPGLPVVARSALDLITSDLDRSVTDVRGVVCSHAHPDHVGGVSTITAATDAEVHLPERCRAYLDGERPRVFPPVESMGRFMSVLGEQTFSRHAAVEFAKCSRRVGFGGPSPDIKLDFAPTDFLTTGDTVAATSGWEAIDAPGHTDDSMCLYHAESATLISGDAVVTQDGAAWFNPEFVDLDVATQTEERLRSLEVRHLLPGHGKPIEAPNVWARARSPLTPPTGPKLLARCSRRLGRWH